MNMTKTMLALVGAALMATGAFADEPAITLNCVQQRYPWNGLVDIDYAVAGVDNPEDYYVKFTVSTNGVDTGATVRSFLNDATLAMASNGPYRVTWDTKADLAFIFSKDVSVKADLVYDPGCKGDRSPYAAEFTIIDLSKGTAASADNKYPVTYESIYDKEVARTNYNTAVYKKEKLVLRKVWKGQFKMGSPVGEYGRYSWEWMNCETEHEVRLTQDFLLGVFEVTQAQYYRVMGSNPSVKNKNNDGLCPVESCTYQNVRGSSVGCQVPPTFGNVDSSSFMGKLSERTGFQFDLPTEAQFEYACRAGTTTMNYAGNFTTTANEVVNSIAWYGDNAGNTTHEVGGKIPNGWGFYDMIGNVWELARDRVMVPRSDNFGYAVTETNIPLQIDPLRDVNANVDIRGGSWEQDATTERAAVRACNVTVTTSSKGIGFRLSRTLP